MSSSFERAKRLKDLGDKYRLLAASTTGPMKATYLKMAAEAYKKSTEILKKARRRF